MVAVQGSVGEAPEEGWVIMTLRLPAAQPLDAARSRERALLIRSIHAWLARHHHAVALPNAEDDRRGDAICVGFRRAHAETALAYRVFCGSLGLTAAMKQFRVVPNRCSRTLPRT